jgi:hypothetical protein
MCYSVECVCLGVCSYVSIRKPILRILIKCYSVKSYKNLSTHSSTGNNWTTGERRETALSTKRKLSGQLHSPAVLPPGKNPGTNLAGGWVGLDIMEEKKFLASARTRTPGLPVPSVVNYMEYAMQASP